MFEVGFTEILVISVLALVVLGPEKLPRVAAQVGRWMGRARAMARQFREQLEDEVQLAESTKTKPVPPQHDAPSATPAAAGATAGAASGEAAPPPVYNGDSYPESGATQPPEVAAAQDNYQASGHTSGHEHDAAAETAHAENPSAPAPEPEAPVYEPPSYAHPSPSGNGPSANGDNGQPAAAASSAAVESPASHHDHDDPPRRPGDFITQTHERGI
jgi:sec-independent protein translocase protein TatB